MAFSVAILKLMFINGDFIDWVPYVLAAMVAVSRSY